MVGAANRQGKPRTQDKHRTQDKPHTHGVVWARCATFRNHQVHVCLSGRLLGLLCSLFQHYSNTAAIRTGHPLIHETRVDISTTRAGGCRSCNSFVTHKVSQVKRDIDMHNRRIHSRCLARSIEHFQHTLFLSHLVQWPLTLEHLHRRNWLDPACPSQHEATPSHKSTGSYFGTPTSPPLEPASERGKNETRRKGRGTFAMSIEAVSFVEIGFLNPSSILQNCRAQFFAWRPAFLFSAHWAIPLRYAMRTLRHTSYTFSQKSGDSLQIDLQRYLPNRKTRQHQKHANSIHRARNRSGSHGVLIVCRTTISTAVTVVTTLR